MVRDDIKTSALASPAVWAAARVRFDCGDGSPPFADGGSDGSTHAWEWISAQSWPGWQVRVLTVQRQGIDHRDPQPPQPWSPASPRDLPAEAEVASLTHMVADDDPREVLSTTPADLLVIGPRGSGLLKPLHVGSVAKALLDNP